MIRKILPVLLTAAVAVALSACSAGRDAPSSGASGSAEGPGAPQNDGVRDRRDNPISPNSG